MSRAIVQPSLRPHVHHDRWARPPVWAWCVVRQTRSYDQVQASGTAPTQAEAQAAADAAVVALRGGR